MMETIIVSFIAYICLTGINHYESGMFGGSLIPSWLCIFCLFEKIIKYFRNKHPFIDFEIK